MYKFLFCVRNIIPALLCLLLSCGRSSPENQPAETPVPSRDGIYPLAILQPGEYPLWFQLTEQGPVLLESIEDARYSAALIPWPLALHFRFGLARPDELLMAVNRDGFLKLAPWDAENPQTGLGLYRFSNGAFWGQYTVGAFVFYDEKPAALLYRDDRFLDSGSPLPRPRTWTFSMESNTPLSLDIPALDLFPVEEGWDADSLRLGPDGFWYFRVSKKDEAAPDIRMLRTASLARTGEDVSVDAFQNSALGAPLSAAPGFLRDFLSAAFVATGSEFCLVISPDFYAPRYFMRNNGAGPVLSAYFRGGKENIALAVLPTGRGLYLKSASSGAAGVPQAFSLPPLPEGFYYTWIGIAGDSLFASWEEQEDYSTGAAGFMVYKPIFLIY